MFSIQDIKAQMAAVAAQPKVELAPPPTLLASWADSHYVNAFNYWTKSRCPVVYFDYQKGLDWYLATYPRLLITSPVAFRLLKAKLKLPPGNQEEFLGSYFKLDLPGGKSTEVITLDELQKVVTMPTMQVLYRRMVQKFTEPHLFKPRLKHEYALVKDERVFQAFLRNASRSSMMAIDIENRGQNFAIDIVSFAWLDPDLPEEDHCKVIVLEIDSFQKVQWMRALLQTEAIKVFQNGIYDNTYFIRYGSPCRNYLLDTMYMFWCWYSDLPLNLALITSFWLRDSSYWKSIVSEDKYLYCALDSVNTLSIMTAMLPKLPKWVLQNYLMTFPKVFPCIQTALYGPRVNVDAMAMLRDRMVGELAELEQRLKVISGNTKFKASSPKAKLALLRGLPGCEEIEGSDKVELAKVAYKGPLHTRVVNLLRSYTAKAKLVSTYLDPRLGPQNTLLFAHSPAYTGTGRFATRSSIFGEIQAFNSKGAPQWANLGFQVQNVPESVRKLIHAPDGFLLAGIDGAQAESRATAYMCADDDYIDAVENSPDFHSTNASKFFGIPFEDIWDNERKVRKLKDVINIAKRVNHGANYNMMAFKLIDTMGEENLWKARALLKLPYDNLTDIAIYLLMQFCKAYPRLKGLGYTKLYHTRGRKKEATQALLDEGTWYGELIREVQQTGKLTGPTGFTRLVHGDPLQDKAVLNGMVAHGPQSLVAMHINDGFYDIWFELSSRDFWPVAQIHDEVLCCYREGHEHLLQRAGALLDRPITVRGKTFYIPPDVPATGTFYWVE